MKKLLTVIGCVTVSLIAWSQNQVGHTTITFNDPVRSGGFGSGGGPGRQIQTEIYYPAASAGDNVPVIAGSHPVIVFGHGFAMAWDAYENIWTRMVEEGYILAFPRTEGSLLPAPSHVDFGKDLALVATKMLALDATAGSLFADKLNGNAGIMGHSMGGGASFLAAQNNTGIKTVVGLAPAETDPEASLAASGVSVPTLILSGSADGVTPPADHHQLIYGNLGTSCKYFLSILGGGHCYFANSNFNCDFGETTSSTGISITRAEQQATMFDYILPWFDFYLKEECAAWTAFIAPQASDSRITPTSTCAYSLPVAPVITQVASTLSSSVTSGVQWYKDGVLLTGETNSTVSLNYGSGSYTVVATDGVGCTASSSPFVYTGGGGANSLNELVQIVAFYPNPTTGLSVLELANSEEVVVTVYSIEGKLVWQARGNSKIEIDLRAAETGLYHVIVAKNGKPNQMMKLMKK